jgi:hypothetical protein
VYDSTNNTVTLTAFGKVPLNQEYALTINGTSPNGIEDTAGNFLEGLNGKVGTNFIQYFGPEILSGPGVPASYKALAAASAKLESSLTTAIAASSLTQHDVFSLVTTHGSTGIVAKADLPLATRLQVLGRNRSPVVASVLSTIIFNLLNPPSTSSGG